MLNNILPTTTTITESQNKIAEARDMMFRYLDDRGADIANVALMSARVTKRYKLTSAELVQVLSDMAECVAEAKRIDAEEDQRWGSGED